MKLSRNNDRQGRKMNWEMFFVLLLPRNVALCHFLKNIPLVILDFWKHPDDSTSDSARYGVHRRGRTACGGPSCGAVVLWVASIRPSFRPCDTTSLCGASFRLNCSTRSSTRRSSRWPSSSSRSRSDRLRPNRPNVFEVQMLATLARVCPSYSKEGERNTENSTAFRVENHRRCCRVVFSQIKVSDGKDNISLHTISFCRPQLCNSVLSAAKRLISELIHISIYIKATDI